MSTQATGVRTISTPDQAQTLARELQDAHRDRPVAVVTIASGHHDPFIDVAELADNLLGVVDVAVMPTGAASWAFSDAMPPGTQVYGGAGRVYPAHLDWVNDLRASPLRFAYSAPAQKTTSTLISDALWMAAESGLLKRQAPTTIEATGTIEGFPTASRALVRLDSGGMATIRQELTSRHVDLEHTFRIGQPVRGHLEQRFLDVRGMLVEPDLSRWREGDVVLARVIELEHGQMRLALVPGTDVIVTRDHVTSNDLDELTELFTVGETVRARLLAPPPNPRLTLTDIDDDEDPLPAPALTPGGPPWLDIPVDEPLTAAAPSEPHHLEQPLPAPNPEMPAQAPAPLDAPVAPHISPTPTARPTPRVLDRRRKNGPAPHPAPMQAPAAVRDLSLSLDAARAESATHAKQAQAAVAQAEATQHELDDLRRQLEEVEAKLRATEDAHATLKTRYRKAQAQAKKVSPAERTVVEPAPTGPVFADPTEQLRHEVYLEWANRIPATEKRRTDLEFRIGCGFIESIEQAGADRGKVVSVMVEVLTGLAEKLDSRELHQLRSSGAGDSPTLTRADGATCWRVALQRKSPGARRMHFWRRGQAIEFSRVVLHDDFTP